MNKSSGFTLMEVLVAVAILSIASVAIMKNFSQSLYNVGRSSASLHYSFTMRFYFEEAVRLYQAGNGRDDELNFEDEHFMYSFIFSEPEFLADTYDNTLPGLELKKIEITVTQKSKDTVIHRQESFHVFSLTGGIAP